MNEDPRLILNARRPGGDDDAEPEMAAALEAAKADPSLAEWSEKQTAVDRSISRALRAVQPPAGLRDRISAGARASRPAVKGTENWFERRAFGILRYSEVVAIAAVFLLLAVALAYNRFGQKSDERTWQMFATMKASEIESGTVPIDHEDFAFQSVVGWLRERTCPAPDSLPQGLRTLGLFGCSSTAWNGKKMGIVCFKFGPGKEVHLVSIDSASIPDQLTGVPAWSEVAGFTTAQWQENGTVYMLMGRATEAEMRPLLAEKTASLERPGRSIAQSENGGEYLVGSHAEEVSSVPLGFGVRGLDPALTFGGCSVSSRTMLKRMATKVYSALDILSMRDVLSRERKSWVKPQHSKASRHSHAALELYMTS